MISTNYGAQPESPETARAARSSCRSPSLRLFRAEYWFGLWIGSLAQFVLWYRPLTSSGPDIIILVLAYSGFLYACGFLANAVGDRELDRVYPGFKREISAAVETVGVKRLVSWIVGLTILGLSLSLWVSWRLGSVVPFALGVVGTVAGLGYSLPPLRWKVRGFASHAISLTVSAYYVPAFLVAGTLNGAYTAEIGLLALGYSIAHYGMEIGNQLKDYAQDRVYGIHTLPFRSRGLSCLVGLVLVLVGLVIETSMLLHLFRPVAWQAITLVIIVLAAHLEPIVFFTRGATRPAFISPGDGRLKYARWLTVGMVGRLLVALLLRLG
jgi:4-hydroxybenzoate polyprenyltransferase